MRSPDLPPTPRPVRSEPAETSTAGAGEPQPGTSTPRDKRPNINFSRSIKKKKKKLFPRRETPSDDDFMWDFFT